jgi:hypothetical protein
MKYINDIKHYFHKKTIIENFRKYHINELRGSLLKNKNLDEARKHFEWIEISDVVINYDSKTYSLFCHLIIALICLLCVGLAWILTINEVHLSCEAISPNLSFTLSEDWYLNESFKLSGLIIDNICSVNVRNVNINASKQNENNINVSSIDINGKYIWLQKLKIPSGSKINLSASKNFLIIDSRGLPLSGRAEAENATLVISNEDEEDYIYDYSETVHFASSKTTFSAPVRLRLHFVEDIWELDNFIAQSIKFVTETDSGLFESTIKSGSIKFLETDNEVTLKENDTLSLKNLKIRRMACRQAKEGIKVVFEGSASTIKAGSKGFEKDLAPTYLEYVYHQQKFSFFCGAVATLWGLLCCLRKVLLSN